MSSCRSEEKNKKLTNRLNRIEGQIRGIKNMINDDRECMDILHQIQSVSSALKGVWEIVAANHIQECLDKITDKSERNQNIKEIIKHMQELR